MTNPHTKTAEDYAWEIREALEKGPTEGPWRTLEHSWSDTSIAAPGFGHGICCLDINHATEESQAADEAQMAANANFIAACHPAALRSILTAREDDARAVSLLTAEVERLKAALASTPSAQTVGEDEPATIGDNTQNWAAVDGAVAWHLIERHADGWGDVAKMMNEWLEAQIAASASVPAAAVGDGWVSGIAEKDALPTGDYWLALNCGHVVMGAKVGAYWDWPESDTHRCCDDAYVDAAMPFRTPLPPTPNSASQAGGQEGA